MLVDLFYNKNGRNSSMSFPKFNKISWQITSNYYREKATNSKKSLLYKNYKSPNFWNSLKIIFSKKIIVKKRVTVIPSILNSFFITMNIYNGKMYLPRRLNFLAKGYKLGMFSRTRKLAKYKAKVKKKKKEKLQKELELKKTRETKKVYVRNKKVGNKGKEEKRKKLRSFFDNDFSVLLRKRKNIKIFNMSGKELLW